MVRLTGLGRLASKADPRMIRVESEDSEANKLLTQSGPMRFEMPGTLGIPSPVSSKRVLISHQTDWMNNPALQTL